MRAVWEPKDPAVIAELSRTIWLTTDFFESVTGCVLGGEAPGGLWLADFYSQSALSGA